MGQQEPIRASRGPRVPTIGCIRGVYSEGMVPPWWGKEHCPVPGCLSRAYRRRTAVATMSGETG